MPSPSHFRIWAPRGRRQVAKISNTSDGAGPLAVATRSEAVDRQVEARQLVQRAGQGGDPLTAASGGVGGSHAEKVQRTFAAVDRARPPLVARMC